MEWVRDTLPWPSAQQDQAKLFHLPPPTMDSSSAGQLCEERVAKENPMPSSLESDPLVSCIHRQRQRSQTRCTSVGLNRQSNEQNTIIHVIQKLPGK